MANVLVGWVTGGLAMVSVMASMFFAGISGSAAADSAAVGSVMIPAMARKGYAKDFAAALIACAGTIGTMIPPSIPMIIYGVTTGTSIGGLFIPEAKESVEMMYEKFEQPFVIDSSKFEKTFGMKATPMRDAIRETVAWYKSHPEKN